MAKVGTFLVAVFFIIVSIKVSRSQDEEITDDIEDTKTCCMQVIELDEEEKKEAFFNCTEPDHILNDENNDSERKEPTRKKRSSQQIYWNGPRRNWYDPTRPRPSRYWDDPRRPQPWVMNGDMPFPPQRVMNGDMPWSHQTMFGGNSNIQMSNYASNIQMVSSGDLQVQVISDQSGKRVIINGFSSESELIINGRRYSGNQKEISGNGYQNGNNFNSGVSVQISNRRSGPNGRSRKRVVINGITNEYKVIINGRSSSLKEQEEDDHKQKAINYMLEGNCDDAANEVRKMIGKKNEENSSNNKNY